jgi:hypothetical protein
MRSAVIRGMCFIGESLGFLSTVCGSRLAIGIGSILACYAYSLLGVVLFCGLLFNSVPTLDAAAAKPYIVFGLTGSFIFLSVWFPQMPRGFRIGAIPAIAALSLVFPVVRRSINEAAQNTFPSCVKVLERKTPEYISADSLEYSIVEDLTAVSPGSYLDLIYGSLHLHHLKNQEAHPSLSEAFLDVGLTEPAAMVAGSLSRYLVRNVNGNTVIEVQFCGFDRICDTCDDHIGIYHWPRNLEQALESTPTIIRR